jgi:hypothetical protein
MPMHNRGQRFLFVFAAWLIALPTAHLTYAQTPTPAVLYAVTFWEPKLITIDTNTGQGTLITNLPISPRDLAGFRDALYVYSGAGQGARLSQLDPLAGTILHAVTFTNKMSGGEGAMDFRADGIAFVATASNNTGTLARLELETTNATLITSDGGLSPSLDGLAFAADGTLFGLTQNRAGAYSLCQLDQLTGGATVIGDLGLSFPTGSGVVGGLAFAPNGNLYAAVASSNESRLYLLNQDTGAASLVGSVGIAGVSGIHFFAPPRESLTVQTTPEGFQIAWPQVRNGLLESTTNIAGPWTSAFLPVTTNGAAAIATNPRNQRQQFFRLRH